MRILITGSDGLVGGAAVEYFDALGWEVHGADNNARKKLFGEMGSTEWNRHRIYHKAKNYHPNDADISVRSDVWSLFHRGSGVFEYDAVIHCAGQPSHDKANEQPDVDYNINVHGTRLLLEAVRLYSPKAVFIFMSTNKVYDDSVNAEVLHEDVSRYDFYWHKAGFDETTKTGASNVFGRNKLEADSLVQNYALAYGIKTAVLRAGCLTGPGHSGVEQHGFLNYLIRCAATGTPYKILGYRGKQVRDNLHSYDVARAFHEIILNPKMGEVYNLGGGRKNSVSIIEAIKMAGEAIGKKMVAEYVDTPRSGDHCCYITDNSKFIHDYPNWSVTKSLKNIFEEIANQLYWGIETEHKETITYPELEGFSTVYDIGGCRGTWAASIAKKYPYARVEIFEPVQEFYEDCLYRFDGNKQVFVYPLGFSNRDQEVVIAKQGINSSTVRGGEGQTKLPDHPILGAAVSETIKLLDISKFLSDHNVQNVDLVSINCEGGEYDILSRLIRTGQIRVFDNIQIQFHHFYPYAAELRDIIRCSLKETHTERFNYPFIWESWKRNEPRQSNPV